MSQQKINNTSLVENNKCVNISTLLSLLGFSENQQYGIASILLHKKCFNPDFSKFIFDEKNKEKQLKHMEDSKLVFDQVNNVSTLVELDDPLKLLDFNFDLNLKQLLTFLVDITQLHLLGQFDVTSTGNNRYEEMEYLSSDHSETKIIECLGLTGEKNWTSENTIKHVFVHGGTENALRARLDHAFKNIQKFGDDDKVYIYYATNPRGIFPFESSILGILTHHFISQNQCLDKRDFGQVIQTIDNALKELNQMKVNWTTKPDGVTKSIDVIMRHMRREYSDYIVWPKFPVHKRFHPEYYNETSILEGRESIFEKWPTAIDLVECIVDEKCQLYGIHPTRIKIVPHLVKGVVKDGKYFIANTVSTVISFRDEYKDKLSSELMAVVTDNSVSFAADRQNYETIKAFGKDIPYILIHDAVLKDKVNFELVCQQVAKTLYSMKLEFKE